MGRLRDLLNGGASPAAPTPPAPVAVPTPIAKASEPKSVAKKSTFKVEEPKKVETTE